MVYKCSATTESPFEWQKINKVQKSLHYVIHWNGEIMLQKCVSMSEWVWVCVFACFTEVPNITEVISPP